MSGKDSQRRPGSGGGSRVFLFVFFVFFLGALKFFRRSEVGWGGGVGNVPLLIRGGGVAAATHTCTRTFSIPDGRASAVKCLTRQTVEVTEGETARVQRDFGPRCEGARQQQQGAAGANEGCAFALYFTANTCACVAIQGLGGGGGNIFRFSIYISRDGDGDRAPNKLCRAGCRA